QDIARLDLLPALDDELLYGTRRAEGEGDERLWLNRTGSADRGADSVALYLGLPQDFECVVLLPGSHSEDIVGAHAEDGNDGDDGKNSTHAIPLSERT